jgi:tRNA-dihydrouridine synthase 3
MRCAQVDFVDVNMGCPIDAVCNKGMGAGLCLKPQRVQGICRAMAEMLHSSELTIKTRIGYDWPKANAHRTFPLLREWGVVAATLHGRSRQQRYSKLADWRCAHPSERGRGVWIVARG